MTYVASLDHYITALPSSPFVDASEIDEKRRFILNENAMFEEIRGRSDNCPYLDWPAWATWRIDDDPPPLFIGAPSDDFIGACHRDLLPLLEDLARRG